MLNIKSAIVICCMALTLHAFSQDTSVVADHYKTKDFDCAIFPASFKADLHKNRFTPTRQEIDLCEKALKKDIQHYKAQYYFNSQSKEYIQNNLSGYKRQYFGWINANGERILYINAYCDDYIKTYSVPSKDSTGSLQLIEYPEFWLNTYVTVMDGGECFWNIQFNLDKRKVSNLEINGDA